jgi:hypothetical protein
MRATIATLGPILLALLVLIGQFAIKEIGRRTARRHARCSARPRPGDPAGLVGM